MLKVGKLHEFVPAEQVCKSCGNDTSQDEGARFFVDDDALETRGIFRFDCWCNNCLLKTVNQ